jgi:hypothetical protein
MTRPTPPWPFFLASAGFSLLGILSMCGGLNGGLVVWILVGAAAVLLGYGVRSAVPLVRRDPGTVVLAAAAFVGCLVVLAAAVSFL